MLTPTQLKANIDALQQQGASHDDIQGYLDSLKNQAPAAPTPAPPQSLSDKIWSGLATASNVVGSVFPGQKLGEDIGTLAGYGLTAAQEKLGLAPKGTAANYNLSAPSPLQAAGDAAQAALTVAAPNIGVGGSALTRIGANTALGAGIGATNAIAQGKDIKGVGTSAGFGALAGGVLSTAAEGVGALVKNLPTWFARSALPKLDAKNAQYALDNTRLIGSADTFLKDSNDAIQSYEGQVQHILSHPEYKALATNSDAITADALSIFKNSDYTPQTLFDNAKNIAPDVSKLISKMEAGQADIQELNTIRKSLDSATKSVYTSLNRPPEAKQLGAALAGAIRDYVQTNAPETAPIFANYSKEIALHKALTAVVKKNNLRPTFKDFAAGYAGYEAGGWRGLLAAIVAERLGGSTSGKLLIGKGAQALQQVAPSAGALIQGTKAPLIGGIAQSISP